MSDFIHPPGGPIKGEFRDAIHELAEQAQEEDRRAWQEAHKVRRPVSYFIIAGAALIVLQGVLYLYLYSKKESAVPARAVRAATRVLPPNSCVSKVHDTYWQIVAYVRDNGHPPGTLNDLVGKYVDKVPLDPETGKPLVYSPSGEGFDLSCPQITAAR